MPIDILISGAGPTGLLLAILLVRSGLKIRIIDENATRAQESRALAIQPRSLELFSSLGIVERFLERGVRARGLSAFLRGRKLFDLNFEDIGRDDTPYPYIFFLSQSITEEILEQTLLDLGIRVERHTKLESFIQEKDEVVAKINAIGAGVEEVRAKYLVGCDGAKSQVRKSLGLTFEGGTYESEFLLADAKVGWELPIDRVQVFLGDSHVGLYMPLKENEYARVITVGKEETKVISHEQLTTKLPTTIEEVQSAFREATFRAVELKDAKWVSRYRVHHRCVDKMRVDRAFLAGDAAHIHSPAGGQGMNTGLQDAANLAWKLALVIKEQAPKELLITYHQERWPVAQHLLKYTDRLFGFASSLNVMIKMLRNLVVPIFAQGFRRKSIRKYLFGFISQLNIHYHPNPFIMEDIQDPRKKALQQVGRRAPDAPVGKSSLFQLISGYQFHVLVMSRRDIAEVEKQKFINAWKEQNLLSSGAAEIHWLAGDFELYQVDEVLVTLVRPDGYISYQRDYLI